MACVSLALAVSASVARAGHVEVKTIGGNVIVTGDDLGNRVNIVSEGTEPPAQHPAFLIWTGDRTTLVEHVTGNVLIRLGDGDDVLEMGRRRRFEAESVSLRARAMTSSL